MRKLELFTYTDHRKFLKDCFAARKTANPRYSYRQFAADLGFKASNYIHLIINNKRNLSDDAVERIIKKSDWTMQQKKYFRELVLFGHAKSESEKILHLQKLNSIAKTNRTLLHDDQFEYFSNWYIPVLRELVSLKGFVSNLNWISRKLKPRVSEDLVLEGLSVLERLGLIQRIKGSWRQTKHHLATSPEVVSSLIHNYHRQMLSLSMQALDLPARDRDISAMTMSVSKEQFQWLKQKIMRFREEVQHELEEQQQRSTMVAQLNVQIFPLTE